MRENANQNNSKHGPFLHSDSLPSNFQNDFQCASIPNYFWKLFDNLDFDILDISIWILLAYPDVS